MAGLLPLQLEFACVYRNLRGAWMYRFHLCHVRGARDKNLTEVCLIAMAQMSTFFLES